MSALIVIDVQNDFITGSLALKNGPAGQDGAEVVKPINEVSRELTACMNPKCTCTIATGVVSFLNDLSMLKICSYWQRFHLMPMLTAWIGILQIIFPFMIT